MHDAPREALEESERGPGDHCQGATDPFRWLEDGKAERTRRWLTERDREFTEERSRWRSLEHYERSLQEFRRTRVRSCPAVRGDRSFYLERLPGADHPRLMVAGRTGDPCVLVDPARVAGDRPSLDAWSVSPDGSAVAVQVSENGSETGVLMVIDTRTAARLDGPVPGVRYSSVAWLPDSSSFYYVVTGPQRASLRLRSVPDGAETSIRLPEEMPARFLAVSVCPLSSIMLVLAAADAGRRRDLWMGDLARDPARRPGLRPVRTGLDRRLHARIGADGLLYLRSEDSAPRGRLCVADPREDQGRGEPRFRELVGERPDAVLTDHAVLRSGGRTVLVLAWRRHAISELTVHDGRTGEMIAAPRLPGYGSVSGLRTAHDVPGTVWFSYTDFASPPGIHRYSLGEGSPRPWAAGPPSARSRGPRSDGARTSWETIDRPDGATIRVAILSPAGRPDRRRPLLLYGYGGFGGITGPSYTAAALAWTAAGGVYALVQVRGGGEEGADWHAAGAGRNKPAAVGDMCAAAEHLVGRGWTATDRLCVAGASNGGLLAAAAAVRRPDLFTAVVCQAALLDMVRFPRSGLGSAWLEEYGDPSSPEDLASLLSYSPYHNVRSGTEYPAFLFVSPEEDARVDPFHSRKMCALLNAEGGGGPAFLRSVRNSGHGARGQRESLRLSAESLAFCHHYAETEETP